MTNSLDVGMLGDLLYILLGTHRTFQRNPKTSRCKNDHPSRWTYRATWTRENSATAARDSQLIHSFSTSAVQTRLWRKGTVLARVVERGIRGLGVGLTFFSRLQENHRINNRIQHRAL